MEQRSSHPGDVPDMVRALWDAIKNGRRRAVEGGPREEDKLLERLIVAEGLRERATGAGGVVKETFDLGQGRSLELTYSSRDGTWVARPHAPQEVARHSVAASDPAKESRPAAASEEDADDVQADDPLQRARRSIERLGRIRF